MARARTLGSLKAALTSWRIGAVVLQSFSSGLPLGLVWTALPVWLAYRHVDIKTIGWFSLVQAPWSFKFLWSPLVDRFHLPFLGRKRSWMAVSQLFLILGIAGLAWQGAAPSIGVVAILATFIAFWSATQDIAIDGYAVEVLEKDEQGIAVGGRIAAYRLAMYIAGALTITLGAKLGWPWVFAGLAILFLPLIGVVAASPEPPHAEAAPVSLREAVIGPFVAMLRRSRALEVLAFILLYKLGENLATSLVRPFLVFKGFSPVDVGLATATIGFVATLTGTFAGGLMTDRFGLGKTLWIAGILQAFGCLGYAVVDHLGGPGSAGAFDSHRLVMYGAMATEALFQGMAAGALDVMLLRATSRKFSATQFALFSSIFGMGRTIAGAFAGVMVDALGWSPFFVLTVFVSIPGLLMLHRFAPLGSEPDFEREDDLSLRTPVTRLALAARTLLGLVIGLGLGLGLSAFLDAVKQSRTGLTQAKGTLDALRVLGQHFAERLSSLVDPHTPAQWVALVGPVIFGVLCALGTAALVAARRGIKRGGSR